MSSRNLPKQPEINIGTAGHVDHGKTTLIKSLTGVWASRHSEELRRGITIKLGYADCAFYKCPSCSPPSNYSTSPKCPNCEGKAEFIRAVSFVDCPGHEVLMTTMLAGAAVMDGALLVISADSVVPQPQTREHLAALEIVGVNKIVIIQNKVDLVSREDALKNYEQIKKFISGTIAENAPIVPISAQHFINVDLLIQTIEEYLPTPKRDPSKPPYMHVVRSFDINKPGTKVEDITGGVLGGTLAEGRLTVDDEIEIKPGVKIEKPGKEKVVVEYESLLTHVTSLLAGGKNVKEASSGGLVGVGTLLDPALSKADGLIGNVVGKPNELPPLRESITIESTLFENVIGTTELLKVDSIRPNESLVINTGTTVTSGLVTKLKKEGFEISLKKPICAPQGARVALSRKITGKWRLIGHGVLKQ